MGLMDLFRKKKSTPVGEEVSKEMAKTEPAKGKKTVAVKGNFETNDGSSKKKKYSDMELVVEVLKDRGLVSQPDIDRKRVELEG